MVVLLLGGVTLLVVLAALAAAWTLCRAAAGADAHIALLDRRIPDGRPYAEPPSAIFRKAS